MPENPSTNVQLALTNISAISKEIKSPNMNTQKKHSNGHDAFIYTRSDQSSTEALLVAQNLMLFVVVFHMDSED